MQGDREKYLAKELDDYITKPIKRDNTLNALVKYYKPIEEVT